jgi:outer membrane protein
LIKWNGMRKFLWLMMSLCCAQIQAQESLFYNDGDPLDTQVQTLPKIPGQYWGSDAGCDAPNWQQPLTLADVANTSLCHNPQTREMWANARIQAAQLGVAKSAYLPTVTDTVSSNMGVLNPESATRGNPNLNVSNSLVASYLLYDFGNRKANIESARQLLLAASATQSSVVQSILLNTIAAYYQVQANIAALSAAQQAERAAEESFKAANARYQAGVATPADKLQAQTAYAQLTLQRITIEGSLRVAYGNLANLMGLPANHAMTLAKSANETPPGILDDVSTLIEQAGLRRPDLLASEAQVRAAQASIAASKAASKPTLSVGVSNNLQDGSQYAANSATTLGVTLSIPIFAGYGPTYRIRAAEATADLRLAQRDSLRLQISLDVWSAYQSLRTALQSVTASKTLLESAEQSYRVAFGRYTAGVGNIIDTLNAQSALANARQQNIQASLNSNVARATLAQAIGVLDHAMIQSLPGATAPAQ